MLSYFQRLHSNQICSNICQLFSMSESLICPSIKQQLGIGLANLLNSFQRQSLGQDQSADFSFKLSKWPMSRNSLRLSTSLIWQRVEFKVNNGNLNRCNLQRHFSSAVKNDWKTSKSLSTKKTRFIAMAYWSVFLYLQKGLLVSYMCPLTIYRKVTIVKVLLYVCLPLLRWLDDTQPRAFPGCHLCRQ